MKYFSIIIALMIFASCNTTQPPRSNTIYVSIAPLAYLVEQIADSTVNVEILVPETTSPETYEPTTSQIQRLSNSKAYINTGLIDFEVELNKSIRGLSESLVILDLSEGVDVLSGSCSHTSHDGHAHGIDPHTWLSPSIMHRFAERICGTLSQINPENQELYTNNLSRLTSEIDSLDRYIRSGNINSFAIAHPSLTYYANDYGIEQIAIEIDGKEPTIAQMKQIIEDIKRRNITKIVTQKQTSAAAAQTIATETGTTIIEFDPLARDWLNNMYYITDQIAQ